MGNDFINGGLVDMEIVLLDAKRFSGEVNGVKVHYIYRSDMSPCYDDNNSLGISPLEKWIPDLTVWNHIGNAPALYKGKFKLIAKGGKPVLDLVDVADMHESVRLCTLSEYEHFMSLGEPVKPEDLPFHPDQNLDVAAKDGKKKG